jgi:hypothetical protein
MRRSWACHKGNCTEVGQQVETQQNYLNSFILFILLDLRIKDE